MSLSDLTINFQRVASLVKLTNLITLTRVFGLGFFHGRKYEKISCRI